MGLPEETLKEKEDTSLKKNKMRFITRAALMIFFIIPSSVFSQSDSKEGSLFIIGGGPRPDHLMQEMINTAKMKDSDYIVILPMASSNPEASVSSMKEQLGRLSQNKITSFNFSEATVNNKVWTDSLANARLVYIVGGSQRRFMKVVLHTPVYTAIHTAFNSGSTIGGTSAGAAMMSKSMITGQSTTSKKTTSFLEIHRNNVLITEGLGLLPQRVIIDQHFIKRSRWNRLISVLAEYPDYKCIGIDESTAIICEGNKARVVGESQVVVLSKPKKLSKLSEKLITFKDIHFSLLSAGSGFKLR